MPTKRLIQTYAARAEQSTNQVSRRLFELMSVKETNLCAAVDETDPDRFLALIEKLGPEVALIKTHVDTIEGYTGKIMVDLQNLAREHNFLIFEDRKFADIGQTVKNQYTKGIFHIVEWADIVNAHSLPGPGIVTGLKETVEEHGMLDKRGILLLAQMSSKDNLITKDYTKQTVDMAIEHSDFVIGFIGAGVGDLPLLASLAPPQMLIMTPGVQLAEGGDKHRQTFSTPQDVVTAGADVIIVGRGIYGDPKPISKAKEYRQAGWDAYQKRIVQPKV